MAIPKSIIFIMIGAGVAVFGILFGWLIFPAILKSTIKKEMAITKKTDARKMWEKLAFPFDFKLYIFNYTNPEEVQKGGVPIVKEIGPYHFEQWKEKVEIEDHEENNTISYKRLDTFYFRPRLSGDGLTGEEIVTIPNIFLFGTIGTVNRDKPAMLPVVGKALYQIFDSPKDVFTRAPVLDIMFRGLMINCDRKEFAPKALCSQLRKDVPAGMVIEPNNQMRFSLFGARNGSVDSKIITVKSGKKNVLEVGTLVAINRDTHQNIWRETCDEYDGTDGTVFPPFMKSSNRVLSFTIDICRPFRPRFTGKTSYQGIKTYHYFANIGDLANDPELRCYCPAPDKCLPKGMMDLAKCLGAPLYLSMPHYLDGDPKFLETVKGLKPDYHKHGIHIDFEPISGTPMNVKQRLQFSIQLVQVEKLDLFKELSGDIVPLFWLEEGFELNKTFVKILKHDLFIPMRIVNIVRWLLISIGTFGVIFGIFFHNREKIMKLALSGDKVSKITPGEDETAKGTDEDGKNISVIGQPQEPTKIDM